MTDRAGSTNQFFYNSAPVHYLDHVLDGLGVTILQARYDANNRLIGVVDANGYLNQVTSDPNARTQTIVDGLGHTTTRFMDAKGVPG